MVTVLAALAALTLLNPLAHAPVRGPYIGCNAANDRVVWRIEPRSCFVNGPLHTMADSEYLRGMTWTRWGRPVASAIGWTGRATGQLHIRARVRASQRQGACYTHLSVSTKDGTDSYGLPTCVE